MQVLTDIQNGIKQYTDIDNMNIGDSVLAYDDSQPRTLRYNQLLKREKITFNDYNVVVNDGEPYQIPTGFDDVWNEETQDYDKIVVMSEPIQDTKRDTFDFYRLTFSNGKTFTDFKHRLFWIKDNNAVTGCFVKHLFEYEVGDYLCDDDNNWQEITDIELLPDYELGVWYQIEISGDSSFVADGITLHNSSMYWNPYSGGVQIDANWNAGGTIWATTDGGSTYTTTPTVNDNAYFSNANNHKCTASSFIQMYNFDFTIGTGFTGTMDLGSNNNSYHGNITFNSGMTLLNTGGNQQINGNGTQNITMSGKALFSFVHDTGNVVLQDKLTISGTTFTNLTGNFYCNGQEIVLLGNAQPPKTDNIYSGANNLSTRGYYVLTRIGAAATNATMLFSLTTPFEVVRALNLVGNNCTNYGYNDTTQLCTFSDTTPSINRVLVSCASTGSAVTITLQSGCYLNLQNVDFQDCTFSGTTSNGTQTANTIGDRGNNTNCPTSYPRTIANGNALYWYTTSGLNITFSSSWSTVIFTGSGGTGSSGQAPLPQDTLVFNNASRSGTGSITVTMDTVNVGTLDFSARNSSHNTSVNSSTTILYGNLLSNSSTNWSSGTGTIYFYGSAITHTITSNGVEIKRPITSNCPGGTLNLNDDIDTKTTANRAISVAAGAIDIGTHNIKCGTFQILAGATLNTGAGSQLTTVSISLSGTWNINGYTSVLSGTTTTFSGSIINYNSYTLEVFASGFTFNPSCTINQGTGILKFSDLGGSVACSLQLNGKILNKLVINTLTSSSASTILYSTSGTINNLTINAGCTLTQSGGSNHTINAVTNNATTANHSIYRDYAAGGVFTTTCPSTLEWGYLDVANSNASVMQHSTGIVDVTCTNWSAPGGTDTTKFFFSY